MIPEKELKWLFLDLNSYFASVEQQENPHLRGRPVAVVPMDTPYTCAIAASPEAKLYGIKTGTIIRDARMMCPKLICVTAHHDKYVQYHDKVVSEVARHTPIDKIWSIDELASRLPPARRNEDAARDVAARIKAGLKKNVGEYIKCSIGIAPNSLLAKIASDMQKPDGLVILRPDNLKDALFGLRLTDLPGIGANMERRLIKAGIPSIEAFWNIAPKHARKIWGSVEGERFWYWLHGYDFPHQETGRKAMIGHSRVLDPALRAPDKTRLMARRLLTKAVQRLRRNGLYAGALGFGVRTVDGMRWQREIYISHSCDPFMFLARLDELWTEMMDDIRPVYGTSPLRFKKVSTLLMSLREPQDVTYDLFDQPQTAQSPAIKAQKNEALAKALDHLQTKYKKETVTLGLPPKTLAGHVGTKIAFARIPDSEEFWG